jgi:hypothetical protein
MGGEGGLEVPFGKLRVNSLRRAKYERGKKGDLKYEGAFGKLRTGKKDIWKLKLF